MENKKIISNVRYAVFKDKLEGNEYGDAAYILVAAFRMENDARWYAKHRNRIQKDNNSVFIVVPVDADIKTYANTLKETAAEEEMIFSNRLKNTDTFYLFADAMEAEAE